MKLLEICYKLLQKYYKSYLLEHKYNVHLNCKKIHQIIVNIFAYLRIINFTKIALAQNQLEKYHCSLEF